MSKRIDLSGQIFGRLTVLDHSTRTQGKVMWSCSCSCGNYVDVSCSGLRSKNTRSCGCLHREKASERMRKIVSNQTGEKNPNYKHGDSGSRLYAVWAQMNARCNCPTHHDYENYGKRGISVAPEFSDYSAFKVFALKNGYTDELTIDKIDNNKGYHRDNIQFITKADNARKGDR